MAIVRTMEAEELFDEARKFTPGEIVVTRNGNDVALIVGNYGKNNSEHSNTHYPVVLYSGKPLKCTTEVKLLPHDFEVAMRNTS